MYSQASQRRGSREGKRREGEDDAGELQQRAGWKLEAQTAGETKLLGSDKA